MTETLESMADEVDQKQLAEQLLTQAEEHGAELTGPNELLNQLPTNVLETALDAEMTKHLGYERHDAARRSSGKIQQRAPDRRPRSPRSGRSRSTSHGTSIPRSRRRSPVKRQ